MSLGRRRFLAVLVLSTAGAALLGGWAVGRRAECRRALVRSDDGVWGLGELPETGPVHALRADARGVLGVALDPGGDPRPVPDTLAAMLLPSNS